MQVLLIQCSSHTSVCSWAESRHKRLRPNSPSRHADLQAFKDGDVRFLICTDVAARGIDIQGLPYVVNMTLPDRRVPVRNHMLRSLSVSDRMVRSACLVWSPCSNMLPGAGRSQISGNVLCRSEDYIHRVGRVGRAEALGLAISLVATVEEKVACIVCSYSSKETPESPYRTWCHLVEAHWTRPRTNTDTSALVLRNGKQASRFDSLPKVTSGAFPRACGRQ